MIIADGAVARHGRGSWLVRLGWLGLARVERVGLGLVGRSRGLGRGGGVCGWRMAGMVAGVS